MQRRVITLNSILGILLILTTGCRKAGDTSRQTLRLSMIPTTDPEKIIRESQPLIHYLEKETGAKMELTIPTNYAAMVEAVASDRVDITYFESFTYVQT